MKTYRAWLLFVGLLPVLAGCGKSTPSEPDAFVKELSTTLAAGELGTAYSYLPPKYQADVKKLVNDAAANMDAEVYDKGFALTGKLTLLLKSKKDFLLASPMLSSIPVPKDKLTANWQPVVDALESVSNSEIKTLDGLKKVDPGTFLGSTGNKLFAIVKTSVPNAEQELANLKNAKVSVVKREGDTATLKIEVEGKPAEEKEFKQVEGKWLPKEMVDDWDKSMTEARSKFSELKLTPEKKTQALEGIKMVDTALDRLLAAPDQAAFDKELAGLAGAVMMGGMGGGGMPMPGPGGPGGFPGPGGAFPGPGVPPGLPGGVPLGTGASAPTLPGTTPSIPALPK